MAHRDIFINSLIKHLQNGNKDIMFLSADFGAPALDNLRANFPQNFVHCGISEQAMIDLAVGLALDGKIVFCYAMAPFISLRSLEQIKTGPAMNDLPIILLSVGHGLGYADAGPTHYSTEDLACLSSIPNIKVYTCGDNETTKCLADFIIKNPSPAYIRIDRDEFKVNHKCSIDDINLGFRVFKDEDLCRNFIITSGTLMNLSEKYRTEFPKNTVSIDIIRNKPFPPQLIQLCKEADKITVIDEHVFYGGLYSILSSHLNVNNIHIELNSINLPDEFIYENGGRNYLLHKHGFNTSNIKKTFR